MLDVALTGEALIAGAGRPGQAGTVHAFDASTGVRLAFRFGERRIDGALAPP